MRNVTITLAIGLFTTLAEAGGTKYSFALSPVSDYVSPHGYLLHEGFALQPEFRVSFPTELSAGPKPEIKKAWFLGAWGSTGFLEIDPYGGYFSRGRRWQFEGKLAYFNFRPIHRTAGDLLVSSAEVGRTFAIGEGPPIEGKLDKRHKITPFLRIENRLPLPALDYSRWIPVVGFKHEWQISKLLKLTQRAGIMYDSGTPAANSGTLVQYKVGLAKKVTPNFSLEPFVRLSLPSAKLEKRENQTIVGITFSFTSK